MIKRISLLGAAVFSASTFAFSPPPDNLPEPIPAPESTEVNFITIGDMGTGKQGQYLVAAAIKEVCEQEKTCEFAVGLGDNIYEDGVDSVHDIQFQTKFEDPYADIDFPFYMTLGNHDNTWIISGDGLDNDRGDLQVEYHYAEDRLSEKWQMPGRYYRFTAPLGSSTPLVSFFSIDSNPLAAVSDADPEYYKHRYYTEQAEWLQYKLERTTTPWKIGFSHHPLISNGRHGNAGIYDKVPSLGVGYLKFLRQNVCGKFDMMLSGHDHDLQILKPVDYCEGTTQIISGAGAKQRPLDKEDRNEAYFQQGNVLGFMHMNIKGDLMTITVYNVDDVSGEWTSVHTQEIAR